MRLQGRISELRTSADSSLFKLIAQDGSETPIRYDKAAGVDVKDGDEVIVTGTNQTDPPFFADTVVKVAGKQPPPKRHTLLYVAIAVVVLLIGGLIYFLSRSSGNAWTITATDSGAPAANVPITLLDANKQPVKTTNTGADGTVTFSGLEAATYIASGPGSTPITATFTKKTQVKTPLPVRSPYTWTVETVTCRRGDANNQLNLVSSSNVVIKTGVTDASGRFAFTDLSTGTYKVLAPGNLTATATVDGTTAPSVAVIQIAPAPNVPCFYGGPIYMHPLQLAPRALAAR